MRTLDQWKFLLGHLPKVIDCPKMCLLSSQDFEPPIFTGSGYLEIKDSINISYTMFASASNDIDAANRLNNTKNNPYDTSSKFRLIATDADGN